MVRPCRTAQVVEAAAEVGVHDPVVVQERDADWPKTHCGTPISPSRVDQGLDPRRRPRGPAWVPPAGAVGHEPQRAVGRPPGLGDRLAVPVATRDRGRAGPPPPRGGRGRGRLGRVPEVGYAQLGPVPGHVRMGPLQPAQPAAVGRAPGAGHEVGPRHQRCGAPLARGVEHHDLVHHLRRPAARRMVLAHHHSHRPVGSRSPSAQRSPRAARARRSPAQARRRRPGGRGAGRSSWRTRPLRSPAPPGPAAVLVDRGAGVDPLGQALGRGAVGRQLDDLRAAGLLGPGARPR